MAENGFSKSRIIHQCEPFPNRFINENVSQHVALAKVYNKTLTHFQKVKTLDQPEIIFELYALSFYRSQNVLCRPKFFEPAQKFDCIYYLIKNFFAGTNKILLNANHHFVWQKMFVTGKIWKWIFGPTQKILTVKKHLRLINICNTRYTVRKGANKINLDSKHFRTNFI